MTAEWWRRGACLGEDPEIFFPTKNNAAAYLPARAICGGCPVAVQCLDYAITTGTEHGMWGGFTERERREFGDDTPAATPERRAHGDAEGTVRGYWREKRAGVKPCYECANAMVRRNNNAVLSRKAEGKRIDGQDTDYQDCG